MPQLRTHTASSQGVNPAILLAPATTQTDKGPQSLFSLLNLASNAGVWAVLRGTIPESETASVTEPTGHDETILARVSDMIDRLIEGSEIFEKEDKPQFLQSLRSLVSKLSHGQLGAISEDELKKRIERIMLIEAAAGMLNDLTPDELALFDAAVKRGKFF